MVTVGRCANGAFKGHGGKFLTFRPIVSIGLEVYALKTTFLMRTTVGRVSASWSGCIVSDLLLLSSDLVAGFVLNLTGRVDLRVSLGILRPELRLLSTFRGR